MNNNNASTTEDNNLILVTGPDGRILEASRAFIEASGFSMQQLTNSELTGLKHPEMPEGPFKDLTSTISAHKPWMGMLQLRREDGTPLWFDAYVIPVIEQGEIVEWQCIFRVPPQSFARRAEEIYRLRKQGKQPRAMRGPKTDLRGRLWTGVLISWVPMLALGGIQFGGDLLFWGAAAGSILLGLLWTGWQCNSLRRLVTKSRELVNHPIKQMIYTGTVDDVGQLELTLQLLQSQLDAVLRRMQSTSGEVLSGANESVRVMARTCHEIEEQQAELIQLATAMEQISATVADMSANTAQTADRTQAVHVSAGQGRDVVAETITSIHALAESISCTTEDVSALQARSQGIGSIISVISDVSEQTNLLALNAAIEAARAGENGRGFAVVADEVRQLAKRTQDSTGEIQQMIQGLQQQTESIVEAMNAKRSLSEKSVERIEEVGQVLEQILDAIDQISDMSTRIAGASEEQNAVAGDVSARIQQISDGSGRTVEDAALTLKLNNAAARLAERQRYLVSCIMQA